MVNTNSIFYCQWSSGLGRLFNLGERNPIQLDQNFFKELGNLVAWARNEGGLVV